MTDSIETPPAKKQKLESHNAQGTTVMWFRTDLRIEDNTALAQATLLTTTHSTCLVGLYVISPGEWTQHDVAATRINFFRRNVACLSKSLEALKIPLVILHVEKAADVPAKVAEACTKLSAQHVFWNTEYEVNETKRDHKVVELLKAQDPPIVCYPQHDQCIVPPGLVRTKEGKIYGMFTPFKKSWIKYIIQTPTTIKLSKPPSLMAPHFTTNQLEFIQKHQKIPDTFPGEAEMSKELKTYIEEHFKAGEQVAQAKLEAFVLERGKEYKEKRDFPEKDGTSRLSPYLSSGVVSARQCVQRAKVANANKLENGNAGLDTWISELCWRDFYKHILYGFPRVCKNKAFKAETDNLKWSYDKEKFDRWCHGKTGFPIVDAGMRQLNATGWMHNRLRMITAMFLVKDLFIDWRWGEQYFSKMLIDGDFASNNGGWQWAASTGTDSVPYFRIFNPALQSERFDPSGNFVRQWVTELKNVKSSKSIHNPSSIFSKSELEKMGQVENLCWVNSRYCAPIVDHKKASDACKAAFQALNKKDE